MAQEPVLTLEPNGHIYRLDGRAVSSVTQVIDFLNSYAGASWDVIERARELGQAVHLATALHDRDDLDDKSVDPAVRPYLDAWIRFREDTSLVMELIEHRVYSSHHGYAGTLDRVARGALGHALIDIKACAKIMPANGPQTAAYKQALIERSHVGAQCLRRYTVRLDPDLTPPYRIEPHHDPNDFNVFLCSLQIANWRKQWK